jgi:hypothetical protein
MKMKLIAIGLCVATLNFGSVDAAKPKTPPATIAPPAAVPPSVQMPSNDMMLIMIRSSLSALSQANITNNYSVLSALSSDSFRAVNNQAKLSENFAPFRANNIDLAPVLLLNPQLSAQPTLANGRLRLIGFFPSQPMQVNFDLTYEPTVRGWKLSGMAVNLNRQAQTAQTVSPLPGAR